MSLSIRFYIIPVLWQPKLVLPSIQKFLHVIPGLRLSCHLRDSISHTLVNWLPSGLTVAYVLATLNVNTSVCVCVASGFGIPLLDHAVHALVGYCALGPPLTVILVGAFFGIGANLIGPVCIVYGTLNFGSPAAPAPPAGGAAAPGFCGLTTWF